MITKRGCLDNETVPFLIQFPNKKDAEYHRLFADIINLTKPASQFIHINFEELGRVFPADQLLDFISQIQLIHKVDVGLHA